MLQTKAGKEGTICSLKQLTFQSDELVFHPQSAEDSGWNAFAADKKFKVTLIARVIILSAFKM